ncbi:DUF6163 family protein [Rhizobium sp. EC-SD404]|uniref:DUF6163 family protein n=1 Tax=Rhizobium sp. EC-SD404 TaxID=2038389 RepID=UPI00336A40C0
MALRLERLDVAWHTRATMNDGNQTMLLESDARPRETLTFRLFNIFQRLVAIGALVSALHYWALLSGLYGGELWRFDLMPIHWRVAATALAVLFPVAAVGLWMPVSWGPVIWFCAAATEIAMHLGFPSLFGQNLVVVALHLAVIAIYAAFRGVLYVEKLRSRRPVRVDSL